MVKEIIGHILILISGIWGFILGIKIMKLLKKGINEINKILMKMSDIK